MCMCVAANAMDTSKAYKMVCAWIVAVFVIQSCAAVSSAPNESIISSNSGISASMPAPLASMFWQRYPASAVFVVAPGESMASLSPAQLADTQNSILSQLQSLLVNLNPTISSAYHNAALSQSGNSDLAGERAYSGDSVSNWNGPTLESKLFVRNIALDSPDLLKMRNPVLRKRTIIRGAWGPGNKHIPLEDLFNCLQMANYGRKDPSPCYEIIKRTR